MSNAETTTASKYEDSTDTNNHQQHQNRTLTYAEALVAVILVTVACFPLRSQIVPRNILLWVAMPNADSEEMPRCKRCHRNRVSTIRSRLCRRCFIIQCSASGAQSAGNRSTGARKRANGAQSAGNTMTGTRRRKVARRAQKRSAQRRSTKAVLVVKNPWLDLILSGKKNWEIRGQHTERRGKIHLALSGTGGRLYGQCCIEDSFPLEKRDLQKGFAKHRITDLSAVRYRSPHAWVLSNPIRYEKPFVYTHKKGAIVWVSL